MSGTDAPPGFGGRWTLAQVGTAAERMERDREISHLEARLAEVDVWTQRIKDLDVLLGAKQSHVAITAPSEIKVAA